MAFHRLIQVAILDSPDRAVAQRSYCSFGSPLGPHIAVKITKIAGIVKGVDQALAAFHCLVETGNASQQHCQAFGRIARSDNVFAPRHASLEFHAIEQASQLVFVMEAKVFQFPTYGCSTLATAGFIRSVILAPKLLSHMPRGQKLNSSDPLTKPATPVKLYLQQLAHM